MNKFLFITHLTPYAKRSKFRQALLESYYKSLNRQSYSNWKVILFCDEDKIDGKFHYFSIPGRNVGIKYVDVIKQLQNPKILELIAEADYVIKLDDDDLISPVLLDHLKDFTGDLFYDKEHTFLDSSSGIITQQERSWIKHVCTQKGARFFRMERRRCFPRWKIVVLRS